MIFVSAIGFFGYSRSSGVVKYEFRHCSVGKIQDGHHLSKVKQYIDILFNTIEADSCFWCLL